MVYLKLDSKYTINRIFSKKDIDLSRYKILPYTDMKEEWITNNVLYEFYNVVECKIQVALYRVEYLERLMKKLGPDKMGVWHGEDYNTLPKTKAWLDKMEIEYPEYFL